MAGAGRRNRRYGIGIARVGSGVSEAHSDIHSLLPLTTSPPLSNTVSCWYCDYKITTFNDSLFRFGRRHARILRLWFSVGTGFSLAALLGIMMILILEIGRAVFLFDASAVLRNLPLSSASLFGVPPLFSVGSLSPVDALYILISTLVSVSVHEFGHAVAAASEGIRMEYVAVFIALLFPGALVAFNYELLHGSPYFAALRIYCAGIWHNAVFSAASGLVLFFLPLVLFPLYIYGESPTVLDVPSSSPLFGYLSPGDVIVSLDGIRVHNAKDWIKISALIDELSFQNATLSEYGNSFKIVDGRKGYCVSNFIMDESTKVQFMDNQSPCANDLTAFAYIPCVNTTMFGDGGIKDAHSDRRELVYCLNPKDLVNLKKCSDAQQTAMGYTRKCLCSRDESCVSPVQLPGLVWVEIAYSSPHASECLQLGGNSHAGSKNCDRTFVFVGDIISTAHSIWLTGYQSRWGFGLHAFLPDVLERMFLYSFHVSLALALLNSLPVYYLDGESILEVIFSLFNLLSSRKRRIVLQASLLGGTLISIIAFLRIFFNFV